MLFRSVRKDCGHRRDAHDDSRRSMVLRRGAGLPGRASSPSRTRHGTRLGRDAARLRTMHAPTVQYVWPASLSSPRHEAARPRIREQSCEPGGFGFGHPPAQRRQPIVAATLVIVSGIGSLAQFFDELGFE